MQTDNKEPFSWLIHVLVAMQWPVVVFSAFGLGCAYANIKHRLSKAEKQLNDLTERHLPHVHNALAAILGAVMGRR